MKHTFNNPRAFYIPSCRKFISLRDYLDMYNKCKANPNKRVKMTISKWYGGTTNDIVKEIVDGIHDRINNKQLK